MSNYHSDNVIDFKIILLILLIIAGVLYHEHAPEIMRLLGW